MVTFSETVVHWAKENIFGPLAKEDKPQDNTNKNDDSKKDEKKAKRLNILLLGETGVGKSTLINSFVNYLSFFDMREAMQQDPVISLIPAKFSIPDYEGKKREVKIGKDDNEVFEAGAAATQHPKSYIFPFDHYEICLIDTPGIADPRGIEKDQENMENILALIRRYETIDAICILLKSNVARLTVTFEFCIKQLLIHLDKSASQNIVYVFTHSRAAFYQPGETQPVLKKILDQVQKLHSDIKIKFDKDNWFCYDNEAFHFLVAVKNGVIFSPTIKSIFTGSWEHSSAEAMRMMQYITSLKPHKVMNTVSINEARRLIFLLSKRLADISENIAKNITVRKTQQERILENASHLEKLKNDLYIPTIKLEFKHFDKPRTVCASDKCRKIHRVNEVNIIHYPQRCHNPCYLTGIKILTFYHNNHIPF